VGGLAYERRGDGPPLVLLHGVGHRWQAWEPVLDALARHRTVIAVDLPGHGDSPPLEPGLDGRPVVGRAAVQSMADAVFALLDELGLDRPHLAGNSLGGGLALLAGASGRAATVTALSPAGFWSARWQFPYARAVFNGAQVTGAALRWLIPSLARSAPGRAVLDAAFVASPARMSPEQAVDDAYAFFRARDAVAAVLRERVAFTETVPPDVPVTIAWGSKDRLLPPAQARVARARVPHATHLDLPGCGHVPMTDNPGLVVSVLLAGSCPRPRLPGPHIRTSGASASRISLARAVALPSRTAGSPTSRSKFRS
jgi:pimeloyl-ACP methyl ester carboxylesterase